MRVREKKVLRGFEAGRKRELLEKDWEPEKLQRSRKKMDLLA